MHSFYLSTRSPKMRSFYCCLSYSSSNQVHSTGCIFIVVHPVLKYWLTSWTVWFGVDAYFATLTERANYVQKLLLTEKSDTQSDVCNWSYTCSKNFFIVSLYYVEDIIFIWTSCFIEMPSKNVAWQQKITLRTILSGALWIRRCAYVCWLESKWEKSSYKYQV